MLALSDGEVEVELIDGNLHLPRVILLGARQESLREEEAADPKHNRLAVFHPGQNGGMELEACQATSDMLTDGGTFPSSYQLNILSSQITNAEACGVFPRSR